MRKNWELGIFTLPLCIQVLQHAEWSCHTMTMEGSGWSEHRWEAQSRFSCVCRYQSFLEIPERIKKEKTNQVCPNVWLVLRMWDTMSHLNGFHNLHNCKPSQRQAKPPQVVKISQVFWILLTLSNYASEFCPWISGAFLSPNILNIYWMFFAAECHCGLSFNCTISETFGKFIYFDLIFSKVGHFTNSHPVLFTLFYLIYLKGNPG